MARAQPVELGIVGVLVTALTLGLYGPHVAQGGFAMDDWVHAYEVAFSPHVLSDYWAITASRPVLVVYMPFLHTALGPNPWLHHLWSLALSVTMSLLLFAVLRRLGIARHHAAAIAILAVLFPWADSTRFWATASHITLSICFGLGGLLLALRGIELGAVGERRQSRRRHIGALLLYALSVLTYEIGGIVLLLTGGLYLGRTSRGMALRLWGASTAVVSVCLAWVTIETVRPRLPYTEAFDHARAMGDGGLSLLAMAAVPLDVDRAPVLVAISAVVAAAGLLAAVGRVDPEASTALRHWLRVLAAGFVVMLAGWVLLVPAGHYYNPVNPGIGNRANGMAALGVVLVIYAVVVLAATLVIESTRLLVRSQTGHRMGAAALSIAIAALIMIGYAVDVQDDQRSWAQAASGVRHVMTNVARAVPQPTANERIFTFNYPGSEAPGVPTFGSPLDLANAVKLLFKDPTITGGPVVSGLTELTCGRAWVTLSGPGWPPPGVRARYGKAILVDGESGAARRVHTRTGCRAALREFVPGPILRP